MTLEPATRHTSSVDTGAATWLGHAWSRVKIILCNIKLTHIRGEGQGQGAHRVGPQLHEAAPHHGAAAEDEVADLRHAHVAAHVEDGVAADLERAESRVTCHGMHTLTVGWRVEVVTSSLGLCGATCRYMLAEAVAGPEKAALSMSPLTSIRLTPLPTRRHSDLKTQRVDSTGYWGSRDSNPSVSLPHLTLLVCLQAASPCPGSLTFQYHDY